LIDQSRYKGNFSFGEFDGQGEISFPNGDRYKGSFKKGKISGPG